MDIMASSTHAKKYAAKQCQRSQNYNVMEIRPTEPIEDCQMLYSAADACIDCPFANKDVVYCKTCPYDT